MNKSIIALATVSLLALASPAMANDDKMTTIEVSAASQIKAVPDVALVTAGVMTNAPTAAAAMQDNATGMTSVYKALAAAGVAEKDIQTSGLSLNAQYDYSNNRAPRVTGYQAVNNVNVILRDLKKAGAVLDSLVAEGSNQINGPTFSVENPEPLLDKARAEAVRKAMKRAELYASAAGLKVKRIISISEMGAAEPSPRPMMMKAMAMEGSASTPVAPGQVEMSVSVNVKFELSQ